MKKILIISSSLILALWVYFHFFQKAQVINGEKAPDFTVIDRHGHSLTLSQLKGKFVILHFWGSWCGPCRRENELLVPIYKSLKSSYWDQLELISIGIEKDSLAWSNAIQKDGLFWDFHASSFQRFDDPIAKLYGVNSIPALYVIDRKGIIIAKNPEVTQLPKLLTTH